LFETRWCLSYLRGPLSPTQINGLMAGRQAQAPLAASPAVAASKPSDAKVLVPPSIPQVYLRPHGHAGGTGVVYRPALLAVARLRFADARRKLDELQVIRRLVPVDSQGAPQWEDSRPAPEAEDDRPLPAATYADVPAALTDPRRHAQMEKEARTWLLDTFALDLVHIPELKLTGQPGETEGEVRIRAGVLLREKREEELDKLRRKQATRLQTLAERERRAAAKVESQKARLSSQRMGAVVSFGAAALSVLMGRKAGGVGRATTGIGSITRSGKVKLDVEQARETLEAVRQQRAELEAETDREMARIAEACDPERLVLETLRVRPRSSDSGLQRLALAWVPYAADAFGALRPAVEI